jgi:enoyl-CoA hydratase/carnithine racemase
VTYTGLSVELVDHVLTVTIDRPEARNAFDTLTMNEMTHVFTRADLDDEVRVVVVTGRGNIFSAGGDLSTGDATFNAVAMGRASDADDHVETAGPVTMSIFRNRKPSIAAINGHAVGFGLTLTLPMDIRITCPDAKLAMSFVRRGIVPDACATWYLPRLVGLSRALDWACSGRTFLGTEAKEAGLVSALHPAEDVLPAAMEMAREYADWASPVAVAVTRQLVLRMAGAEHPLDAYPLEAAAIFELGTSADCLEGIHAFKEKRRPQFTGRVSQDLPRVYPWWSRDEGLNDGVLGPAVPFSTS